MSEEWTDWFDHDGKGCPCKGLWVQAVFDRGFPLISEGIALGSWPRFPDQWDWAVCDAVGKARIIRYRIRRPRALLQLIEMVENLPAPAQPRVDA